MIIEEFGGSIRDKLKFSIVVFSINLNQCRIDIKVINLLCRLLRSILFTLKRLFFCRQNL